MAIAEQQQPICFRFRYVFIYCYDSIKLIRAIPAEEDRYFPPLLCFVRIPSFLLRVVHMNIHLMCSLRREFAAMVAILVLNTKIVLSFEKQMRRSFCKAENKSSCVISCREWDLNWNWKHGARDLKEILKEDGKEFDRCTLLLEKYTRENITWAEEVNPEEGPKVVELKIFHSRIDFNDLQLNIFKNLRGITLKNTTTASLRPEAFRRLQRLEKLRIKKSNLLKWVEKGFLDSLNLRFLQVQGIVLNAPKTCEFFRNLTGGHEIPSIRGLDWSHNNFGNFTKDLLAPFPNLEVLILVDSGIFNFEDDTFTHSSIHTVRIDRNEIRKLPEHVFRPLLEVTSLASLEGNDLICDCEMTWLQSLVKLRKCFKNFRINCAYPEGVNFFEAQICPEGNPESTVRCTAQESLELSADYDSWSRAEKLFPTFADRPRIFSIKNEDPEIVEITLPNYVDAEKTILWYGNYANSTLPQFDCLKNLQQQFCIRVTPETNYLICLASEHLKIDVFDCLPFKTKPLYGNQPWLTNKSITLTIIIFFLALLFAIAMGALILYLSVRKHPSLIRGSKRVIQVKRHDKAQIMILPRGYEHFAQPPMDPARASLSCDTISTVSYVSANQPTQLEILTYRLNRLRELFQSNYNLPPPTMQIAIPSTQRLPPNVDLLFEYEWYTITTTTTTSV